MWTPRFYKDLERHKKLFETINGTQSPLKDVKSASVLLGEYEGLGKELALAFSKFTCEKCGSTKNLQYHHLIERPMKRIMGFNQYFARRQFAVNIAILCHDCHANYHKRTGKTPVIPDKIIDEVRKRYGSASSSSS